MNLGMIPLVSSMMRDESGQGAPRGAMGGDEARREPGTVGGRVPGPAAPGSRLEVTRGRATPWRSPRRARLLAAALAVALAAALPAACAAVRPADPGAAAEADARAADLALAAAATGHDPARFEALLAPDALFLGARDFSSGRSAILAAWAPALSEGGPRLSWAPAEAVASIGGDVAVTRGSWQLLSGGAAREGRYVTVWRREPDGRMRAVLDAGDEPLPPLPVDAVRRPLATVASADGRLVAEAGLLAAWGRGLGQYLTVRLHAPDGWRTLVDTGRFAP